MLYKDHCPIDQRLISLSSKALIKMHNIGYNINFIVIWFYQWNCYWTLQIPCKPCISNTWDGHGGIKRHVAVEKQHALVGFFSCSLPNCYQLHCILAKIFFTLLSLFADQNQRHKKQQGFKSKDFWMDPQIKATR